MQRGVRALARDGFVLTGLLLVGVGLADLATGKTRAATYRAVLAETPPPARAVDKLFPTPSEAEQQRVIAEAKLGYYELLGLVGQLLAALGTVLVGVGMLRVRLGGLHPSDRAAQLR